MQTNICTQSYAYNTRTHTGVACSQAVVTFMHYFTLVSRKSPQQYFVYLPTLILTSVLSV